MRPIFKLSFTASTLALGFFLAPSHALAGSVECSNDLGSCMVSNDPFDTHGCTCEGNGTSGTTGGSDLWSDLSDEELLQICEGLLMECEEGDTTTGDPTEGEVTTFGTDSTTTGGEPTGGDSTTEPTGGEPTGGDSTTEPTGGEPTGGDSTTGGEPTGGDSTTDGEPTGGDSTTTTDGGTDGTTGTGTDSETGTGATGGESGSETGQVTGDTEGHDSDADSDGASEDDKSGCSIAANAGTTSILSLGLMLGLVGLRRRKH